MPRLNRYPGLLGLGAVLVAVAMVSSLFGLSTAGSVNYGDVTVEGGFESGHFGDVWDLTDGDITVSFTYDANGMVDDAGAHAWAELGVRSLMYGGDFNPTGTITIYPEMTYNLLAAQHIDIGDVVVQRIGDTLYIKFIIQEEGWFLVETHVDVRDDQYMIPQTTAGNPIPGKFNHRMDHDTRVTEYEWAVDVSSLGTSVPLYIAAHAHVLHDYEEYEVEDKFESAWAGDEPFYGDNWAKFLIYDPGDPITVEGSGVWLATDYDWTVNTFDPDPVDNPVLDMDDKLILQRKGGTGEAWYNLPATPPNPGNNHRIWWDRDGVDPWQNDATANTGGLYQVVITLHAISATTGTAYMTINGLSQGFETDGDWSTIELTPAGMTWTGDMRQLVIFYGIYGYGAIHSATFQDIVVSQ